MIFLDSSYLIDLIIDNDQHHTKTVELKSYLEVFSFIQFIF